MQKSYPQLSIVISLSVLVWSAVAVAQTGTLDIVHRSNGPSVRGIIQETSPTEITIETRGSTQTIPVNEIRQIVFTQEPSQLRRARDLIQNGQLENGRETLDKIDMSSVTRDVVRTEIDFLRLLCEAKLAMASGKDVTNAASALFAFAKDHGSSYHFFSAVETLGELAMAVGRYSTAGRYYGHLTRAPWPELQLRGLLLESNAYIAETKYAEAAKNYEKALAIESSTSSANRLKSMAEIGRARCHAELGRQDDSIAAIERIIAESDPEDFELMSQAYNALGSIYRRSEKANDARDAYLHVDLLYHQAQDQHAEALFFLAELWENAKRPERARQARNVLTSRYPASRWVNTQRSD